MTQVVARPRLLLEAGGLPLEDYIVAGLCEVRVNQVLSAPAQCQITLLDYAGKALPSRITPGAELTVTVEDTRIFEGDITAVEYSYSAANRREIHLRGYDRLHRLRKRQSVRAHVEVTPADLARELVSGDGLTVDAVGNGPLFANIIQSVQSDLDLLLETTSRCGLYLYVHGKTLRLLTAAGSGTAVSLELGKTLLEARVEVNGDAVCRSVTADGWNTARAEHHQGHAKDARNGRSIRAEVAPSVMSASGERFLVDEIAQDTRHADLLAQAEIDERLAREVVLTGVAAGDARLAPGVSIRVEGIASDYCGKYVLTSVSHSIDSRTGFLSEFSTEPPRSRTRPRGAVAAMAVVTRVDDPENLGRVRVLLPAYANVETGWAPVLTAGAGARKGFTILPDVDDTVLVLLPRQDPAEAIVLGGLFGVKGPPDSGVEQAKVKRWLLRTAGGHRLQFDDARQSLRLEDSSGTYLEFSPKLVLLHSAADLRIEAPGHGITIGGATVDFERT